ncbi:DOPA 4,5-dioxygenase family protein, partial [Aspergillus glaucus CBS 516.65]
DPAQYTFDSPLKGWEHHAPLPETKSIDGKSFDNPERGILSDAYENFTPPISNGGRQDTQLPGFDVHVYFNTDDDYQTRYARDLWTRIRLEFPELRVYPIHTAPNGPHAPGMFEVALFTPHQFGAFVSWLVVHRGPLSALVHPNTDDELRDHLLMTTWLGPPVPLDMQRFRLRPECETLDRKRGSITKVLATADGHVKKEARVT